MTEQIFFITGTSGSGKSVLTENLKKELSVCKIYDFDEGGVPENADSEWRKERTNSWLKIAKQEELPVIVCGVSVPEEIQSSPEYNNDLHVRYGYIHIPEETIRERLEERGWSSEEIDNNVNWAKALESYVLNEENHLIVDGTKKTTEVASEFSNWIRGYVS